MTVEKPAPITTGASGAMNQSELLAITKNLRIAREKSRLQDADRFWFCLSLVEKLARNL